MKIRWAFVAEGMIAVIGSAIVLYAIYKVMGRDLVGFTDGHS